MKKKNKKNQNKAKQSKPIKRSKRKRLTAKREIRELIINGKKRKCYVWKENGKRRVRVVDDQRKSKEISMDEARKRFNQKSRSSRLRDLSKTSKKILKKPNESWAKNTGRYDVQGIDTQNLSLKNKILKSKKKKKQRLSKVEKLKKKAEKLKEIAKKLPKYPKKDVNETKELVEYVNQHKKDINDLVGIDIDNDKYYQINRLNPSNQRDKIVKIRSKLWVNYYKIDKQIKKHENAQKILKGLDNALLQYKKSRAKGIDHDKSIDPFIEFLGKDVYPDLTGKEWNKDYEKVFRKRLKTEKDLIEGINDIKRKYEKDLIK